jgi:hypothetical protein
MIYTVNYIVTSHLKAGVTEPKQMFIVRQRLGKQRVGNK